MVGEPRLQDHRSLSSVRLPHLFGSIMRASAAGVLDRRMGLLHSCCLLTWSSKGGAGGEELRLKLYASSPIHGNMKLLKAATRTGTPLGSPFTLASFDQIQCVLV